MIYDRLPDSNLRGIYAIVCAASGRRYVGRSGDIRGRVTSHFSILRNRTHYSSKFQNEYDQYGEDNFKVEVLEICPQSMLLFTEDKWLRSFNENELLNKPISSKVGAVEGEITEETRLKLSQRQIGEKNHFYGKTHTAEYKQLRSDVNPARREDVKDKIRNSKIGRKKMTDNDGKYRQVKAKDIEKRLSEGWKIGILS